MDFSIDIIDLQIFALKLLWLVGFYGISTSVGYLVPNPALCYICEFE